MRYPSIKKGVAAGVLTVVAAGASLLVTPQTACACERPWMTFLSTFGLSGDEAQDTSNLDGKTLTVAAKKHWIGKPLSELAFPASVRPERCARQDASELDCDLWISSGLFRDFGLRVQVHTDTSGLVRDATVTDLNRLFGQWVIESPN
jgi:hypothetical protein